MRSLLTHFATFGVAAAIALGAVATASAATHHKRRAAPVAQDQMTGQDFQLAPRNTWQAVPPASQQGPYGCVTDEGYGRYDACDIGGAS
jgi:cell division protein FtsN